MIRYLLVYQNTKSVDEQIGVKYNMIKKSPYWSVNSLSIFKAKKDKHDRKL